MQIDMIEAKYEFNIVSMMASFEKNPDMKGMPIRARLDTPKIVCVVGVLYVFILIIRISW